MPQHRRDNAALTPRPRRVTTDEGREKESGCYAFSTTPCSCTWSSLFPPSTTIWTHRAQRCMPNGIENQECAWPYNPFALLNEALMSWDIPKHCIPSCHCVLPFKEILLKPYHVLESNNYILVSLFQPYSLLLSFSPLSSSAKRMALWLEGMLLGCSILGNVISLWRQGGDPFLFENAKFCCKTTTNKTGKGKLSMNRNEGRQRRNSTMQKRRRKLMRIKIIHTPHSKKQMLA